MKIKKHIPNILSSMRLLSPLVLIPLILNNNLLAALLALSGFLATDALDGYLARKWHAQSDLGAKIDAIADKTILASLLIPLAISNPLMIITLIFEGLISITNVIRKVKGGNPKTVQIGRIKMVVISLFTVFVYLTKLVLLPDFIFNVFFAITTLFQLGTLSKYIEGGLKERKKLPNIRKDIEDKNKNNEEELDKGKSEDLVNEKGEIDKLKLLQKEKNELLKFKEELLNINSEKELEFNNQKGKTKSKKMS